MTEQTIRTGLLRRLRRSTAQKGLTLAETLMVLAIGAVAIVGGTILYMQASRNSKMNAGIIQLATLSSQVRTTFSGQSSYGDAGSIVAPLLAANAVPPDMRITGNTTTLRNAWGGNTTVASISSGTQFTITFNNVPADACVRLPTINAGSVGGAFASVTINGTDMPMPVQIAAASARCVDRTDGNILVFTYQ